MANSFFGRMVSVLPAGFGNCRAAFAVLLGLLFLVTKTQGTGNLVGLRDGTATITEGKLLSTAQLDPIQWTRFQNKTWQKVALTDCWNHPSDSNVYTNPGLFYTPTFGFIIANKKTFQEDMYPQGKYWADPTILERTCICGRTTVRIQPDLTINAILKNVTYMRQSGVNVFHIWEWNNSGLRKNLDSSINRFLTGLAVYKTMVVRLFKDYIYVTADCQISTGIYSGVVLEGPSEVDFENMTFKASYQRHGMNFAYVTCKFYGKHLAFQVLDSDFVVQELDSLYLQGHLDTSDFSGGKYETVRTAWGATKRQPAKLLAPSTNIWPALRWAEERDPRRISLKPMNFPQDWSDKIRWLQPIQWQSDSYDGEILKKKGPVIQYMTHPSLRKGDSKCSRRVAANSICQAPVGGLHSKLRFWDSVFYDPASNSPRFPSHPLTFKGSGRPQWGESLHKKVSLYQDNQSGSRNKRQIFGITALVFAVENSKAITDLTTQMNLRIGQMSDQLNVRFSQDLSHMKIIADKLDDLSHLNYIESKRMNSIILTMLESEQARSAQMQFLESQVTQNEQIALKELDIFLNTVQTVHSMSLSELSVDKLVLQVLKNSTTKPIFNRYKAYELRIRSGILHLREFAQLTSTLENQLNSTNQRGIAQAEQLRKRLSQATANENLAETIYVNSTNHTKVYLNDTGWIFRNFTLLPLNVSRPDFLKSLGVITTGIGQGISGLVSGAGKVLKSGVSALGGILSSGIGAILSPFLKILLPIGIVVVVLISLCCLLQHHPRCESNRQRLPSYFRRDPSIERRIRESNSKHQIRSLLKESAEAATVAAL